jgi:hypothetical protein
MNNVWYAAIIYIIFVLVFGIKNYLLNREISLSIKISHLLLTFLIFQYYFIDFRKLLWEILEHSTSYTKENISRYKFQFDFITSIIYFFNCAFVSGLTLNMAMKAKSRKLFLYSSPIIVSITSIDLYKFMLIHFEIEAGGLRGFFVIFLLVSSIFIIANLYYNLPPGKKVFMH